MSIAKQGHVLSDVWNRRYKQPFESVAQTGKLTEELKIWHGSAPPQVFVLGVSFPAAVERRSKQPKRIDDVGFASVIFTNQDC